MSISNWISERITEASTHEGLMVAIAASLVLFGGFELTKVILWAGFIWGVWSTMNKD